MPQQFANNFATQVRNTFTAVSSSLDITTGDGNRLQGLVPNTISGPNFVLLTLVRVTGGVETDWEIVRVTAQAGDTLTVSRVQEPRPGQVAVQWEVGERIEARLTRDSMNALNVVTTKFDSSGAAQAFTPGGQVVFAHGLGVRPLLVNTYLRNVSAEHGYSSGDVVLFGTSQHGAVAGFSALIDTTNITLRINSNGMKYLNKNTGDAVDLTSANWVIYVTALV